MNKPLVQHLLCLALILMVAFAFTLPAFQDQILNQSDVLHWKGMSSEAKTWNEKTGEPVYWSNSMFGGMPTATYAVFGVRNFLVDFQSLWTDHLPTPFYMLVLAMICFYIMASAYGWNKWMGLIGAIAYAFISYNLQIIVAGHNTKMQCIAYMPAVIAGLHWLYTGKRWLGASVFLLFTSLMFIAGMYQIIFYCFIVIGFLVIYYLIEASKSQNWKNFMISSVMLLFLVPLSIAPTASGFFFTKEYTAATMRGGNSEISVMRDTTGKIVPQKETVKREGGLKKDYAFQWSQGIGETFTLLVPNLYGGGSGTDVGENSACYEAMNELAGANNAEQFSSRVPTYWGAQPFLSGPNYFGAIVIFLMVLGMIMIRNRMKWFLFGVGMLAIMMSWGRHFELLNYFLFDHLPMYNKFRTPSMIMAIPALTFMIIALWALHSYLFGEEEKISLKPALMKSAIITGGLCLLLTLGGKMFLSFRGENDPKLKAQLVQSFGGQQEAVDKIYNAIVEDRSSIAMKDGFRSLIFIALAFGLLWLFTQKRINQWMALGGIGLLMAIDIISIGTRYMGSTDYVAKEDYERQIAPRPVDNEILATETADPYYRVFDLSRDTYSDALGAFHHKLVGGYSPAKMEIYQDLIDLHMSQHINPEVLNMLNTKYIIQPGGDGREMARRNPGACGNAWFVKEIQLAKDANEEISLLDEGNPMDSLSASKGFHAKDNAVVQQQFWKGKTTAYPVDSSAYVKLTKYGLNDLAFESQNSSEGFAVFADIYYNKGWKAFIDGKETEIVKTNYVLRGLMLPAGKHQITFKFEPQSFLKWSSLSTISSLIILLLAFGGIIWSNKNQFLKRD